MNRKSMIRERGKRRRKRGGWLPFIFVFLMLISAVVFYVYKGGFMRGKDVAPFIVAVDAGHGGLDAGAVGLLKETELTEKTASYLYELLEADPNFSPVLCRKNGEAAELDDRFSKLRFKRVQLLISIHGNADTLPESYGFECYPTPPGREWHEESLRFAELLAAEMEGAGARLRGEGGVRYMYFDEQDRRHIKEVSDTNIYIEDSLGILERSKFPAVLVEQCFITNTQDAEAFATEEGCRKAAGCYYRAICGYFGTEPV